MLPAGTEDSGMQLGWQVATLPRGTPPHADAPDQYPM